MFIIHSYQRTQQFYSQGSATFIYTKAHASMFIETEDANKSNVHQPWINRMEWCPAIQYHTIEHLPAITKEGRGDMCYNMNGLYKQYITESHCMTPHTGHVKNR